MKPLIPQSAERGLTLIELLVALSLFALLGLLTWQATHHLTQARTRIGDELARWREITVAMHRIESETLQVVPGADGLRYFAEGEAEPGTLAGLGGEATSAGALRFAESLSREQSSPQRSALVFSSTASADDAPGRMAFVVAGERLEWWLWPEVDAVGTPERVVLLEQVRSMRWRFLYRGNWLDTWPPETSAAHVLPAALAIDLELADAGNLVRILALH